MRSDLLLLTTLAAVLAGPAAAREPLVDEPVVWWVDDREDVPEPAERDPSVVGTYVKTTFTLPVYRHTNFAFLTRAVGSLFGGEVKGPAHNVNALDEVPNSTWFTNRIGLFPMTAEEVGRGAGTGEGPDRSAPWTIVRAKTEGVTPGFNVKDANGRVYVIKFDPKGYRGMTTGAGAIAARILHAAGYNVPEDVVVTFGRDDLVLGEGVQISDLEGKRDMVEEDLDEIFARVDSLPSGDYVAISSRYLSGKPVGPFSYRGRRGDDPNDRVSHEHRRELRGLRLFAGWINHFDTKQHNSLDMWVEEDGKRFVKHYLIDFASTLGAGARGPVAKYGREYGYNFPRSMRNLFTVGLVEDDWRTLELPEGMPELGYWESEVFTATNFEPSLPNTAFAMTTDRDGYWAAKIISAFTDEHLRAVAGAARYRDPATTAYVARVLGERRDILVREYFRRIAPIDFFRVEGGRLRARDLGVERGYWTAAETRYRARSYVVDESRDGDAPDFVDVGSLDVPLPEDESRFRAFEFQVDRGDGWSGSVVAYVATGNRRVVAVDR